MKTGYYIENIATGALAASHPTHVFETGSSIKSPIAALALDKAQHDQHDPAAFTLSVTPAHYSNGSGVLRFAAPVTPGTLVEDRRRQDGHCTATLGSLVELNIIDSDCIATNVLIDYLGGKEAINAKLTEDLGTDELVLMTNRLHFPGVDHYEQPFQVGKTTMAALGRYYRHMILRTGTFRHWPDGMINDFSQLHARVHRARLFSGRSAAVAGLHWYHKTGSIIDRTSDRFFANVVDAGVLMTHDSIFSIAAATLHPQTETVYEGQLEQVEATLASNVMSALGKLGVQAPDSRPTSNERVA